MYLQGEEITANVLSYTALSFPHHFLSARVSSVYLFTYLSLETLWRFVVDDDFFDAKSLFNGILEQISCHQEYESIE